LVFQVCRREEREEVKKEGRRREEGGKKEGRRREEGEKKEGRRREEGGKEGSIRRTHSTAPLIFFSGVTSPDLSSLLEALANMLRAMQIGDREDLCPLSHHGDNPLIIRDEEIKLISRSVRTTIGSVYLPPILPFPLLIRAVQ
jgi:hypothetical protein